MISGILAALVFGGASVVANASPEPPPPPSIAQLCAATSIAEVDALLDRVASSELVGQLSPLVSLTVPDAESPELDASVQLEDVRARLNCDTVPSTPVPDPDDGDGYDQVDEVPSGPVDTGGGPPA